jgi:DNA-binding NarL/FixJ family response regulator
MEPVDGFALLGKIRCDPTASSLSFIFVSGQIRADFVERARMADATAYIVKTSSPKWMIEIIRHALNGRPGDAFNVAHSLPSLETAEALIFGAEREPVH